MKIAYQDWNANAASLALVEQANSIISEYNTQGYTLTLRQLYYQFVSRDLIPNTERSYKNLGVVITKARMAGLIDWYAIEDRNRSLHTTYTQESDESLIRNLPYYITFDQWERQDNYVEVWVEKEALGNVIAKACDSLQVPHMACKGYLSASEAWRAGRRYKQAQEDGKRCYMIHLGDHDPSGIDMTRDNSDRITLFSEANDVAVRRIALNMDQVDAYNPPPNPAKLSDTRAKDYIAKYGKTSWELDALEPKVLVDLIQGEVKGLIDFDVWEDVLEMEREKKALLQKLSDKWHEIKKTL